MANTPFVSVVVPVYNMAAKLPKALDSVLKQTLHDIEVVVVDDGSTDASLDVALSYARRDARVHVIHQENSGSGAARNIAMNAATGIYLAFLDPDDWLPSDGIYEALYLAAENSGLAMAGGNVERVDDDGTSWGIDDSRAFHDCRIMNLSNTEDCFGYTRYIFKRELIRDNCIVFPGYRRGQDPVFMTRVMEHCDEFFAIPDTVYSYQRGVGHVNWTELTISDLCDATIELITYASSYGYRYMYTAAASMLFDMDIVIKLYEDLCGTACMSNYKNTLCTIDRTMINNPKRFDRICETVGRLQRLETSNTRKFKRVLKRMKLKHEIRGAVISTIKKTAPNLSWKLIAMTARSTGNYES